MEKYETELLGYLIGKDEQPDNEEKACDVTPFPEETPIAMAYVPYQQWAKPYDPEAGLCRGTLFPALDKPFIGEEAVKNGKK